MMVDGIESQSFELEFPISNYRVIESPIFYSMAKKYKINDLSNRKSKKNNCNR